MRAEIQGEGWSGLRARAGQTGVEEETELWEGEGAASGAERLHPGSPSPVWCNSQ